MKIKSPFKDYYDFVAWNYGGGDPSLPYIRNKLKSEEGLENFEVDVSDVPNFIFDTQQHRLAGIKGDYSYSWLSVCGVGYLLVRLTGTIFWTILNKKDHAELWNAFEASTKKDYRWEMFVLNQKKTTFPDTFIGNPHEIFIELSKKINSPVFSFSGFTFNRNHNSVIVDSRIPILQNIGLDKIIKPEQLYQNISYFMGNVLRDSPDLIINDNMSDKEKILQHGFDTKQSFRHRK